MSCTFSTDVRKGLWSSLYLISAGLFASWSIGALGLSIAWLLLLALGLVSWFWNFAVIKPLENAFFELKNRLSRSRSLQTAESAEWLNLLMNQWLQKNKDLILGFKNSLENSLNKCKPSFVEKIEIIDVTWGEELPVFIQSLKALHLENDRKLPLCIFKKVNSRQLALEFDVVSNSKDFRIVLKAKLFGNTGVDVECGIENVQFMGRGDLTITLNPNNLLLPNIVFSLTEKPNVSFQLQIFKGIHLMEVPLFKNWLHNFVMETIELKLVDPSYLVLPEVLSKLPEYPSLKFIPSEGVLIVSVSSNEMNDCWIEIWIDGKKQFQRVRKGERVGFLIQSLNEQVLFMEIKQKQLVVERILEKFQMPLNQCNLKTSPVLETNLENINNSSLPDITLKLEFTPLPWGSPPENQFIDTSGVLNIQVHSAKLDIDSCSPFCEIYVNHRQVLKTHHIDESKSPVWESQCQVLVQNMKETCIKFLIYSRDEILTFLGDAVINLNEEGSIFIHRGLELSDNEGTLFVTITCQALNIPFDSPKKKKVNNFLIQNCATEANSNNNSPHNIPNRPKPEKRLKLGIPVPTPTPPQIDNSTLNYSNRSHSHFNGSNVDSNSLRSLTASLRSITDSPDLSTRPPSVIDSESTIDNEIKKSASLRDSSPAFQSMRLKMSKSLRLLRFKSEDNIREIGKKPLEHTTSQPDITKNPKNMPVFPPKIKDINNRPDTYSGVEGRVVQAQGLHVAHVANLYCRVKLILNVDNGKYNSSKGNKGKTVAESRILPAMPNPQFHLEFQLTDPEIVPRTAILLFEIRGSGKEIVASRKVTLQNLLSGELRETHTWLALNNGATLEVNIAQGRVIKKPSKKLFRSWSVHRIGKI